MRRKWSRGRWLRDPIRDTYLEKQWSGEEGGVLNVGGREREGTGQQEVQGHRIYFRKKTKNRLNLLALS